MVGQKAPTSLIPGPPPAGERTRRINPIRPESPIPLSTAAPQVVAPAMYCLIVAGVPPSCLTAAVLARKAARNEKIGRAQA